MKLHEIIESDGLKRLVIGFDSENRPITKPYDGDIEENPADKKENESNKDLIKGELEQEITEEPPNETPVEGPKAEEFKCQYCGQICKSKTGLIAHEKACKGNPANK